LFEKEKKLASNAVTATGSEKDPHQHQHDDDGLKDMEFPLSVMLNPLPYEGGFYLKSLDHSQGLHVIIYDPASLAATTVSPLKQFQDQKKLSTEKELKSNQHQRSNLLCLAAELNDDHDDGASEIEAKESCDGSSSNNNNSSLKKINSTTSATNPSSTRSLSSLIVDDNNPLALFQSIDEPASFESSFEVTLPNVGDCLELWFGGKQERKSRSVKVTIHEKEVIHDGSAHEKVQKKARLVVSGDIPSSWYDGSSSDSSSPLFDRRLFGARYSSNMWIADADSDFNSNGTIELTNGLFPAPLPQGCNPSLLVRQFKFLGRLFAKVSRCVCRCI